jgi:hypothetical protein
MTLLPGPLASDTPDGAELAPLIRVAVVHPPIKHRMIIPMHIVNANFKMDTMIFPPPSYVEEVTPRRTRFIGIRLRRIE